MRRILSSVLAIIVLVLGMAGAAWFAAGCGSGSANGGQDLYQRAKALEDQGDLAGAGELYQKAFRELLTGDDPVQLRTCREAAERIALIQYNYPLTEEEVRAQLSTAFPQAPRTDVDKWIADSAEDVRGWGGTDHYFRSTLDNIAFGHPELLRNNPQTESSYRQIVSMIHTEFIDASPDSPAALKSGTFRGTQRLAVPRSSLPDTGTLQIWFPVPINEGSQTRATVESVSPDIYVKGSPDLDGDIGLIYMEVPLEQLKTDLAVEVKFVFTRSEKSCDVDHTKIGQYDKADPLYVKYTRSAGNVELTPEIQAQAARLVGDEKNPYLAARAIYDHIVANVRYAFVPHELM